MEGGTRFMKWTLHLLIVLLSLNLVSAQDEKTVDLVTAIETALKFHPSLKAYDAQIDAAFARRNQVKAGFAPKLDMVVSYTQLHREPSFTVANMGTIVFGEKDNPQLSWMLKIPVYTGGKLEGMLRQAEEGIRVAERGLVRQRQKVAMEAAIAYFNVLKAKGFLKVMEGKLRALRSQRDDISKMLEQGVATKADLLRAEAAVAAAQEELTKARNIEALSIAALANAMGLHPSEILKVEEFPPITETVFPDLPASLEAAISEALRQRLEISVLEAQLKTAMEGVKVAASEQKPQIGLILQYDAERQTIMPEMGRWLAGVMLTLNLFDGGATKAAVEQAKSQVKQIDAAITELRNAIALEVTNAFLNLSSAKERVKAAQQAVAAAEEGVRLVRLGYQNGVNTLTDFLSALSELTSAQTTLIAAYADLRIAEVQFWFALGRNPESLLEKLSRRQRKEVNGL